MIVVLLLMAAVTVVRWLCRAVRKLVEVIARRRHQDLEVRALPAVAARDSAGRRPSACWRRDCWRG